MEAAIPLYNYRCGKCGHVQEETCSINEFKEFKPECIKCGTECKYEFTPTTVQFVLKDGPSGSWPSKGNRINKQMVGRSRMAAKRQRERYGKPAIIPNYKSIETGTWAEAQSQALNDRDNPDPIKTAATYTERVASERKIV